MATKTKIPKEKKSKFQKFFVDEIKDTYLAEKNLVIALAKMSKDATSAFDKYLEETKVYVNRLDEVFEILCVKLQTKLCEAMARLVKEVIQFRRILRALSIIQASTPNLLLSIFFGIRPPVI